MRKHNMKILLGIVLIIALALCACERKERERTVPLELPTLSATMQTQDQEQASQAYVEEGSLLIQEPAATATPLGVGFVAT